MRSFLILPAILFVTLPALLLPISASAEEFNLPADVVEITEEEATEDITAELLQAVIWTESRGDAEAVSADGYNIGLMQLHRWYFSGDLTDKENNIQQGTEYLQSLYNSTGSYAAALMKYHGETNAETKAAAGNVSEYARQIITLKEELEAEKWRTFTRSMQELCRRWQPDLMKKPAKY